MTTSTSTPRRRYWTIRASGTGSTPRYGTVCRSRAAAYGKSRRCRHQRTRSSPIAPFARGPSTGRRSSTCGPPAPTGYTQ
eukprot:1554379-Lingulodinium_polyedra.AAC.1